MRENYLTLRWSGKRSILVLYPKLSTIAQLDRYADKPTVDTLQNRSTHCSELLGDSSRVAKVTCSRLAGTL